MKLEVEAERLAILVRRVVERTANGGIPITADHMESYRGIFQPPTEEELSLFDPPRTADDPAEARRRHRRVAS